MKVAWGNMMQKEERLHVRMVEVECIGAIARCQWDEGEGKGEGKPQFESKYVLWMKCRVVQQNHNISNKVDELLKFAESL